MQMILRMSTAIKKHLQSIDKLKILYINNSIHFAVYAIKVSKSFVLYIIVDVIDIVVNEQQ
jgi:hypothetical protein